MADSERSNSKNPEMNQVLYDRQRCAAGWQVAIPCPVVSPDLSLNAQLAEYFWVTMGKITALQNVVVCRCSKCRV